jgi:CRP-like cAMP-binding protein
MVDSQARFVAGVALFAELTPEELDEILGLVTVEVLAVGDLLFQAGDAADAAYLVRTGTLEVLSVRGDRIVVVGPGDVVGELSLLDGAPRSASLRAVDATEVLRIDKPGFDALRAALRPGAFKVIRAMVADLASRIRNTNSQLATVLAHDDATGGGVEA